jgi:inhibitor of KinA
MEYIFQPLGDNAIIIKFENRISPEINAHIRRSAILIEQSKTNGIIEWIPTYTSLTLFYKPEIISYTNLCKLLETLLINSDEKELPLPKEIIIPTCYGGKYGADLESVALKNNLTPEEVIKIHSTPSYLVYMLGFTPGFPYLGGMDKRIATPRLETPRALVEAGSVGIAGEQTGMYSIDSPGGWQIIGKTPLKLFDINSKEPFLLKAGYLVKFKPISEEEYYNLEKEINYVQS